LHTLSVNLIFLAAEESEKNVLFYGS
jgi:hypothetical protein